VLAGRCGERALSHDGPRRQPGKDEASDAAGDVRSGDTLAHFTAVDFVGDEALVTEHSRGHPNVKGRAYGRLPGGFRVKLAHEAMRAVLVEEKRASACGVDVLGVDPRKRECRVRSVGARGNLDARSAQIDSPARRIGGATGGRHHDRSRQREERHAKIG
jgi:hypothetical protein